MRALPKQCVLNLHFPPRGTVSGAKKAARALDIEIYRGCLLKHFSHNSLVHSAHTTKDN